MKKLHIGFIILALCLALALQGCGGPGNPNPDPIPTPTPVPGQTGVVHVSANIASLTTWTNDKIYVIDRGIFVNAPLTIQPGTIIKFELSAYISVSATGSINADGTDIAPITFTSIRDDSIGGDTNGDGIATSPTKGDWVDIKVGSSGSIFDYCRFYYGGSGGYQDDALVEVAAFTATFTNCIFAHSKNAGLDLAYALATSTVTGNTFFDNTRPLWIAPAINLDDSNVFHDPDHPTQGNAYNGVWIGGSATIRSNTFWGETEVAFVLTSGVSVEAGDTLTLQPGVTVKTMTGSIHAGGKIVAAGNAANRITFTSYKDDTKGGDTNNNGSDNAPAKGNWGKLYFSEDGSILSYCDIYYGGTGTLPICEVQLNVGMTIDHCNIAHGINSALNVNGADRENCVITNNAFFDTTKPLLMNPDMSISATNSFHNPANASEKNAQNGIWLQASSGVHEARNWEVTEVPYICSTFGIESNKILTIASGAILKFQAGTRLDIGLSSSINGFANVTFTSIKDDARGGDTNGDGGTSTPAANDWNGIQDFTGGAHWITTGNIYYDSH